MLGHWKTLLRATAAAHRPPLAGVQDEGERRQLTVMFCDVVGSTALAARMDPKEMYNVVDRHYAAIAAAKAPDEGALVYLASPRPMNRIRNAPSGPGPVLIEAVHTITAG